MSKGKATKARILGAARRLLEASTTPISMQQIADAAGVTRQLLYVHFGGRADLLLELSRAVDAEVRTPALQRRIDDAPGAVAALREMVAVQGTIKPRIHGVASAIDRLRATDEDAAAAWNERERARLERTALVIRRLADEGKLAGPWSVRSGARLAWSATSQRAWSELVLEGGWPTETWVEHDRRGAGRARRHREPDGVAIGRLLRMEPSRGGAVVGAGASPGWRGRA
jgi:AcrR family transcriptional regulator